MTTPFYDHLDDDALVLHFYGESQEPVAVQIHLASCERCAAHFEEIASTLAMVQELPVPERNERYGLEVWQRLRPELPANRPLQWWPRPGWPVLSLAAAVLVAAAFLTGRYWPDPVAPPQHVLAPQLSPDAEQRVRLAALADHLERSERVLLDLTDTGDSALDVSVQQSWAADLVDANRLHREAASQAGDATIAAVLDDLERNLLDIINAPSTLTPAELAVVRARLDAAALLFKVRILSNELRERENAPIAPRKTT